MGLAFQLGGTFSGGLGVGAGLGGAGSHLDLAGPRCSLAFFGFFGSRPRLSRLPMTVSLDVDVMVAAQDTSECPRPSDLSMRNLDFLEKGLGTRDNSE